MWFAVRKYIVESFQDQWEVGGGWGGCVVRLQGEGEGMRTEIEVHAPIT